MPLMRGKLFNGTLFSGVLFGPASIKAFIRVKVREAKGYISTIIRAREER